MLFPARKTDGSTTPGLSRPERSPFLRFPDPAIESEFQQTYFQRWLGAMRWGTLATMALMIPAAIHNYNTGILSAVAGNVFVLAGCGLYLGLLGRPEAAARGWKAGGFLLACLFTLFFFYVDVTSVPHLGFVRTPEHVADLFQLIQILLLVYIFVAGRFPFRWYAAYALLSFLVAPLFVGIGEPSAFSYFVSGIWVFAFPVSVLLVIVAYYQELTARGEFIASYRLAREMERSEALLINILPEPIAHRLRALDSESSRTIADGFREAGVLFADIVDFTPMAARMEAVEVVSLLNEIFTLFDTLAEKHGIEKIKTIGDAYMAATGLPVPVVDHAAALAAMALDLRDGIGQFRRDTGEPLVLRIGLNAGPVVAGVIGTRRLIYDLWGDTVNVASRMESGGEPGTILATESVYNLLRDRFLFGPAVIIDVKGRGPMPAYALLDHKTD